MNMPEGYSAYIRALIERGWQAWQEPVIRAHLGSPSGMLTAEEVRNELPLHQLVVLPEPDSAIADTAAALATARAIQSVYGPTAWSYIVIRRECRTSLSANRGRWHISSISVFATLTPTSGCSPWRLRPALARSA